MKDVINSLIDSLFIKNYLFWIILILGLISCFFYKEILGFIGEKRVKRILKKLPKKEYYVLNNVLLKNNNITHQIDHIIFSKYGIFVIETKQYNGYIKGNEYDKKWISNNKYYINNPIHQNYGHIKCLSEILRMSKERFISIICISGSSSLNIKTNTQVIRSNELLNTILSYNKSYIYNPKELYEKIKNLNITDINSRNKHVINTRKRVKQIEKRNINKCPLCGGNLILRKGKYSKFYGCSNYPKCRYTKK